VSAANNVSGAGMQIPDDNVSNPVNLRKPVTGMPTTLLQRQNGYFQQFTHTKHRGAFEDLKF